MSFKTNTDNLFREGTFISAKTDPARQLKIIKYYQRIYYCAVVDDPNHRQLVYFERELINPAV